MNEFSSEQLSAVKRINKCTNYYDILNVDQDANDATIKKSYKKLALLLHPDKNKAPGAIDAFKKLGTAAAVLTDKRKRSEYDLVGSNDSSGSSFQHDDSNIRFQSANISPEDFFNIFFNSDFNNFAPFNQNRVFTRQQTNYYGESDDEQDEFSNYSTENRSIDERSLIRKLLNLVFIFVISSIVNAIMRPSRRR